MSEALFDFMPDDGHQLFRRTFGDALAAAARKRWPRDTAKQAARAWDLDPSTASNLTKGHASERTITKAVKAEGWSLLTVLGEALTGETYEQHLQRLVHEAEDARRRVEQRRAHVARLEAIAAVSGAVDHGAGDLQPRERDSRQGGRGHGLGAEEG